MKCLLMTPPTFNMLKSSLLDTVEEESCFFPPLGLLMVAAYAESVPDVEVRLIDAAAEKLSWEEIARAIREIKPDVVGIQILTFTIIDAFKLAAIVREVCPSAIIFMGGPHTTLYPGETVAHKDVDYVIYGEGEFAVRDFLTAIRDKRDVSHIPGVVSKDTDVSTLQLQYIDDLDALLPPARHLININNYFSSLSSTNYVTTMMSSRGCPGRCIFCDRPHMGKVFRKRSALSVYNEMAECVNKWGIKEIVFYDDTFTVDKKRVLDLCKMIQENKLKVKWDIRARIDTMNSEMIEALSKSGCERIHYGIETGDARVQRYILKNLDLSRVREVIAETKKHGIETLGYFMLGLPSETLQEMQKTIDLMCSLPLDYAHITVFTPYPGTRAYHLGLKEGLFTRDYWREFACNPDPEFVPTFWTENVGTEQLLRMVRKAYKKFYFRPGYLLHRLLKVKSFDDFRKKARVGFGLLTETFFPQRSRQHLAHIARKDDTGVSGRR